jgi:hypothetical protein
VDLGRRSPEGLEKHEREPLLLRAALLHPARYGHLRVRRDSEVALAFKAPGEKENIGTALKIMRLINRSRRSRMQRKGERKRRDRGEKHSATLSGALMQPYLSRQQASGAVQIHHVLRGSAGSVGRPRPDQHRLPLTQDCPHHRCCTISWCRAWTATPLALAGTTDNRAFGLSFYLQLCDLCLSWATSICEHKRAQTLGRESRKMERAATTEAGASSNAGRRSRV